MQGAPAVCGHVRLERLARELVTERQRLALTAQKPGSNALIKRTHITAHLLEQPSLDPLGHNRHCPQDFERAWRQSASAREHGIANARRYRPRTGGKDLGYEERIPARHTMKLQSIRPPAIGELAHGRNGQRLKFDSTQR